MERQNQSDGNYEELEPERRSLYGGHVVIFLLQRYGPSDSNSNGGLKKRHFKCSSWSGIVYDSIPENEWRETEAKAGL